MKYVYLLRSRSQPTKTYIGITDNLDQRLLEHNSGKSIHTSRFKPWLIEVAICFVDDERASAFERYLKSGSGHAFAKRHLWTSKGLGASGTLPNPSPAPTTSNSSSYR
ncbi:MAG: GIY-YIG nuclease family protein [candidate division Zixibacteria bacterium]|nr:GIY-YIG nuclease family protein [candidate division Zixibacteria bacterium]